MKLDIENTQKSNLNSKYPSVTVSVLNNQIILCFIVFNKVTCNIRIDIMV